MRNYDSIKLKIQRAGTLVLPWKDFDRAVILINGQDFLQIAKKEEKRLFIEKGRPEDEAGVYHSMSPAELYGYLSDAENYKQKQNVPVLTCSCDETGCSRISLMIRRTGYGIIWKDIHNIWGQYFDISYLFKLKDYEEFMAQLKKLAGK